MKKEKSRNTQVPHGTILSEDQKMIVHLEDIIESLADRLRDRDNTIWKLCRILDKNEINYQESE